jgi:ParB/RepB/Spo0J family partition protein
MAEAKEFSIKALDVHVDDIFPNENNTNEMTEREIQRLAEEIREVGFMNPVNLIPTQEGKYLLLGGEHRWRAARLVGLSHIPALIHTEEKWTDRDLVDLQTFKLNAIHGRVTMKRFADFYRRMSEKFGAENVQNVLAVQDDSEWKKLTKNIHDTLKASGASEAILAEVKQAEKKAKTPDDLSKMLEKIFRKQAKQIASNTIVFQYDQNEYVLIKASADTYVAMKRISEIAAEQNKDVNELLAPAFQLLAKDLEQK